jgi:uncharacterized lipoprotein YmbA
MKALASVYSLLLGSLAACVSGPPPRVFLLASPADAGSRVVSNGRVVQLQNVILPDFLDTTDILLRAGPHEVKASTTGQWGERLSQGITHALQADLSTGGAVVTVSPPTDTGAPQILVTIDDFDVWPDGHCVLAVHWTILRRPSEASGLDYRAVITAPPAGSRTTSDASLVAVMAGAVQQLAQRIREKSAIL